MDAKERAFKHPKKSVKLVGKKLWFSVGQRVMDLGERTIIMVLKNSMEAFFFPTSSLVGHPIYIYVWGNEAYLLSLFDKKFHPNQCLVKYLA